MGIDMIDGLISIRLDAMMALALACLLWFISEKIRISLTFFKKYCIPSPVIGGFSFAVITFFLKTSGMVTFSFDGVLSDLFLYGFFVTIGLGTNLSMLKKGGKVLVAYVAVCWGVAFVQSGISVGLANVLSINPLQALAAGAPALEGGHGLVAALCPVIEQAGGQGALVIGMAAATYGLVSGSLIGGPVGNWLIKRNRIAITTDGQDWDRFKSNKVDSEITGNGMLKTLTLIMLIMAFGTLTARWLTQTTGYTIPAHVFSLFCGLVFRSLNETCSIVKIDFRCVEVLSVISLELFLTMAMMGLKIWELAGLAIPLIIILIVQTIAVVLISIFVIFRITGKDYDAALLSAGFIGHALGATANGLVVMDAVSQKYGLMSKKAFFIIPVSGSMLIDIVGVPSIIVFINLLS